MPIRPFIEDDTAFDSDQIAAMSRAFDNACKALLSAQDQYPAREAIAVRLIDLARLGIVGCDALANRVVDEAKALRSL
jgi:hypothetical protein